MLEKVERYALAREIARIAHETHRQYCMSIGDHSVVTWDEADDWQCQSTIAGVLGVMDCPEITASGIHAAWCEWRKKEGWTYGDVKDVQLKKHPLLVDFEDLPDEHKMKDVMFLSLTKALIDLCGDDDGGI